MKVFITGSNGLLGQKLVIRLLQNPSIEVYASSKGDARGINASLSSDFSQKKYHYLDLNINDKEVVIEKIKSIAPNIIIHCAAMTQVDLCEDNPTDCFQTNSNAIKILIEGCAIHHSFLVFLSTDFIFDGLSSASKLDENTITNPLSIYGKSKLQAEQLLFHSKIEYAIVRTSLVYGFISSNQRNNIVLWILNKIQNNEKIRMVNDQWRSPTLAEDLANGCYLVAMKKPKGIINISGGEILTPYNMAIKTAHYFKLNHQLIKKTLSNQLNQKAIRPKRTALDIVKAEKLLQYSPQNFEQGLSIIKKQLKNCNIGK